jgi:hypothetical protein
MKLLIMNYLSEILNWVKIYSLNEIMEQWYNGKVSRIWPSVTWEGYISKVFDEYFDRIWFWIYVLNFVWL